MKRRGAKCSAASCLGDEFLSRLYPSPSVVVSISRVREGYAHLLRGRSQKPGGFLVTFTKYVRYVAAENLRNPKHLLWELKLKLSRVVEIPRAVPTGLTNSRIGDVRDSDCLKSGFQDRVDPRPHLTVGPAVVQGPHHHLPHDVGICLYLGDCESHQNLHFPSPNRLCFLKTTTDKVQYFRTNVKWARFPLEGPVRLWWKI